ncbi:The BTB (BR-C, ttk and bab)/POZ (Pox virus and Zinc finger) domain [Ceratobasidium sp. AG-Ba]|nr:The BTB (BR-C, ttk and bab)/POZ (Pox virus and Zinc finger) domain [Ceratobasidium sp. AG-Ba]QRW10066.1 The BTB (BR-C, ttk and bab)/POZ (Pox virus and Zinc finger) domain [Ceratobasidium sp. AG-Ba]
MAPQTKNRHTRYYFEDGSVVFLTSDKTLFRLHKSILKLHSPFFDDLFQLDQPDVKDGSGKSLPPEGSSDDKPIAADVQDVEFEAMCKALYEMPLTSAKELSVDHAVSLLLVSTKFQFEKIHKQVVDMLEECALSPWRRYALAIDCLVDPWIVRSYIEICSSVEYNPGEILAEFARRNETEKLSRLMTVREDYRTKLLMFSYGSAAYPYPKHNPPASAICNSCLPNLKTALRQMLSGDGIPAGSNGVDVAATPLLPDRFTRMIQPNAPSPVTICGTCRQKEKLIVSQILGVEDLEAEVKKVMHLTK